MHDKQLYFKSTRVRKTSKSAMPTICDPSPEEGPYGNCESIDPGQPAQSVQTAYGRNFSLFTDFVFLTFRYSQIFCFFPPNST